MKEFVVIKKFIKINKRLYLTNAYTICPEKACARNLKSNYFKLRKTHLSRTSVLLLKSFDINTEEFYNSACSNNFNVICVKVSWFSERVDNSERFLEIYSMFRSDRKFSTALNLDEIRISK